MTRMMKFGSSHSVYTVGSINDGVCGMRSIPYRNSWRDSVVSESCQRPIS